MKKLLTTSEFSTTRTMVVSDGEYGHYKKTINISFEKKERNIIFEIMDMCEEHGFITMTNEIQKTFVCEYHITDEFVELIIKY